MPNATEVSKVENLRLYIDGWRAGATFVASQSQMGAYTKGYSDGREAFLKARKLAAEAFCISVDDLLDLVEKSETES